MTAEHLELQARIDLAAALRWASKLGFGEGVCNHFSMALPGEDDRAGRHRRQTPETAGEEAQGRTRSEEHTSELQSPC